MGSYGGALIPPFNAYPAVSRGVAELFTDIKNDTYDLGRDEFVIVPPTLEIKNDANYVQDVTFEFDMFDAKTTFWDFSDMILTGDVKIVTKENRNVAETINASVCNNALFSLFKSARLNINGVDLDVQQDFPHITQIYDTFNTNKEMRQGILREGGMIFDDAGQFNGTTTEPQPPGQKPTMNTGYVERQKWFATMEPGTGANASPKYVWNTKARTFMKHFSTAFHKMVPAAGVYAKLTLVYSSDNWDHYFIAAKPAEGKTLKPHLSNLLLRIKTYHLDNNQAALETERRFLKTGLNYQYNYTRVDRFLMTAGNKVYKTNLINQGDNFLTALVTISYSQAADGDVTLNPFEFLIQNVNGWKGTVPDTGNMLQKMVLKQGEKQLNKVFPSKEIGGDVQNLDGYLRNCRLCGVLSPEQRSYYDTTYYQYLNGYGTQVWTCSMVQPDIASPVGRLSTGPTEFEFHFKDNLRYNLLAKFVFILPRVVTLHPQSAKSNVVKVEASSYL